MSLPVVRRLLATLVMALCLAPPAAAADDVLELIELSAQFPDRSFVLTLPEERFLGKGSVQVRENGELVPKVTVLPAVLADQGVFGVVLAIDTSHSMRGKPIREAMAAARAFVAQRNENQQVAVVFFNGKVRVALPFTTSQDDIDAVLAAEPPLAVGTRIYDAVETGLSLLAESELGAGSIIVLSDGADRGSRTTPGAVSTRARAGGVRLFAVGLRGRSFEPASLTGLASATNGAYTEAAAPEDLAAIFSALGSKLANEYLLQYRSDARPDSAVKVSVTVDGIEGIAVNEYLAPPLAGGKGEAFSRSFAERYWRSPAGMVVTSFLSAALVAVALMSVLRPRRRTLRKRMAEFVSIAVPEEKGGGGQPDLALSRAEKTFERARWWARFKLDLELAEIRTPPFHLLLWIALGTLLVAFVAFLFGGLLFVVVGLAVPLLARSVIGRKVERKRRLFADQLPDNLQVLSSALRAGHSLVGALSVVVDDCPEPSRSEFRRIVGDEQLGVALEDAIGVVAVRMESRDLEQVALVAALQRETGGNTAEVLDRVADTVRNRFELRRLVRTLTTQGRMSRWVVSLLPVGLLALITLINPEYMKPLYLHPIGRVLLLVAGVMVVAGSLVIKRIINIKV